MGEHAPLGRSLAPDLVADRQAERAVDPLNALVIDDLAVPAHEDVQASVAKPRPIGSTSLQFALEVGVVLARLGPLGRAIKAERLAGAASAHPESLPYNAHVPLF